MIYDAIEGAYSILLANFVTDMVALAAAKGVSIITTVDLIKRQRAETFVGYGKGVSTPAIGIYGLGATTQARDQTKRDSQVTVVFDYYATGTDPSALQAQAELAAEAILLTIDKIWSASSGVFGAGEVPGSVTVTLDDAYLETTSNETQTARYAGRAVVTVPVWDRDTV